jgi:serine phosphatase RsbU (regulator of sigma subunit)
MLAVPFRLADAPAVLAVATTEDEPRADTAAFVRSVATRIGLAADNARLLDQQQSLAWTLQKALLPRELPEIPGMELAARYRPASSHSTVGGDFYDVFATEKGWYIVVGDVCGKGPEAAQLTGLVRHTLRTAVIADPAAPPSSLLVVLNQAVLDQTAASDYCTVVCARVGEASDSGRPVLCSAGGHPAPFVRKGDGETELLPTRGPLVGVFEEVDFADVEFRLRPGDTMFFYTDGLLEARSGGRFFGADRLRETLRRRNSAESLVAFVEETIIAFAGDGQLNDDVVLVAVHEAEDVAKPVGLRARRELPSSM